MDTKLFIRILLLGFALVGVLLTMVYLKHNNPFAVLLPPPEGTPATIQVAPDSAEVQRLVRVESGGSKKLMWCTNRVKSLTFDGHEIVQEGRKWQLKGEVSGGLDFIAVEKWLAQHCIIMVDANVELNPSADEFQKVMKVVFIDGEESWFERTASGVWKWQNQAFRSQDFDQSYRELQGFFGSGK